MFASTLVYKRLKQKQIENSQHKHYTAEHLVCFSKIQVSRTEEFKVWTKNEVNSLHQGEKQTTQLSKTALKMLKSDESNSQSKNRLESLSTVSQTLNLSGGNQIQMKAT